MGINPVPKKIEGVVLEICIAFSVPTPVWVVIQAN